MRTLHAAWRSAIHAAVRRRIGRRDGGRGGGDRRLRRGSSEGRRLGLDRIGGLDLDAGRERDGVRPHPLEVEVPLAGVPDALPRGRLGVVREPRLPARPPLLDGHADVQIGRVAPLEVDVAPVKTA